MDPLPPPEVWTPLLQFLQGPAPEAGGVASAPEAGGVASPLCRALASFTSVFDSLLHGPVQLEELYRLAQG